MAKMKMNPVVLVLIGIGIILVINGGFFGTQALLPPGQYEAYPDESTCTAITNHEWATTRYTDFDSSSSWIAIDGDNDGTKEAYGYYTSQSSVPSGSTLLIENFNTYEDDIYAKDNYIYVSTGMGRNKKFRMNHGAASEAILQCSGTCTPDWSCTSWGTCQASCTQTRICTDANSCGTTSGKPAESQACTGGSCTGGCTDECTPQFAGRCSGNTIQSCRTDHDGDSCLEWGDQTTCPSGYVCQEGGGSATCVESTPGTCTMSTLIADHTITRTELGQAITSWASS